MLPHLCVPTLTSPFNQWAQPSSICDACRRPCQTRHNKADNKTRMPIPSSSFFFFFFLIFSYPIVEFQFSATKKKGKQKQQKQIAHQNFLEGWIDEKKWRRQKFFSHLSPFTFFSSSSSPLPPPCGCSVLFFVVGIYWIGEGKKMSEIKVRQYVEYVCDGRREKTRNQSSFLSRSHPEKKKKRPRQS